MPVAFAMTSLFLSVKSGLIKVRNSLKRLNIERLATEGKGNRKNIDGLLIRLGDIKDVLDDKIVFLSGKSIRRVRANTVAN